LQTVIDNIRPWWAFSSAIRRICASSAPCHRSASASLQQRISSAASNTKIIQHLENFTFILRSLALIIMCFPDNSTCKRESVTQSITLAAASMPHMCDFSVEYFAAGNLEVPVKVAHGVGEQHEPGAAEHNVKPLCV
jgi:hypothetical protein